jgi:hypothetical protein
MTDHHAVVVLERALTQEQSPLQFLERLTFLVALVAERRRRALYC